MGSPYGFELVENCVICKLRSDSFFCSLPKTALEAFDKIKYSASYPAGACYSWKASRRAEFTCCAKAV